MLMHPTHHGYVFTIAWLLRSSIYEQDISAPEAEEENEE
jgi:hypothetical protein